MDNFLDLITSFLHKPGLETTGQKVTTLKELNGLTQFLMLSEKKLKDATAHKVSKSLTLLEEEQDLVWNTPYFKNQRRVSRQNH